MPHIYGERIRFRAAEKEDIPTFVRWFNDPEVTENLAMFPPMSRFEEETWYENMMQRHTAEHILVIEIQDQNAQGGYKPIGNCAFHDIDWRNRSAEVGITIGEKDFWDQGYGTEAMRLLLKHGFETINLHRIWLRVFDKNKRGIRSYQKAGFQLEGNFRQSHYQHGKYHDTLIMSILKDEWLDVQLSKKDK
jgi:RimJ/RimL family protein N-acetyltransferase